MDYTGNNDLFEKQMIKIEEKIPAFLFDVPNSKLLFWERIFFGLEKQYKKQWKEISEKRNKIKNADDGMKYLFLWNKKMEELIENRKTIDVYEPFYCTWSSILMEKKNWYKGYCIAFESYMLYIQTALFYGNEQEEIKVPELHETIDKKNEKYNNNNNKIKNKCIAWFLLIKAKQILNDIWTAKPTELVFEITNIFIDALIFFIQGEAYIKLAEIEEEGKNAIHEKYALAHHNFVKSMEIIQSCKYYRHIQKKWIEYLRDVIIISKLMFAYYLAIFEYGNPEKENFEFAKIILDKILEYVEKENKITKNSNLCKIYQEIISITKKQQKFMENVSKLCFDLSNKNAEFEKYNLSDIDHLIQKININVILLKPINPF